MGLYNCPECGSDKTKTVEEITPIRTNPGHKPKGGGLRKLCKECQHYFRV